jgi:hypothetical protein
VIALTVGILANEVEAIDAAMCALCSTNYQHDYDPYMPLNMPWTLVPTVLFILLDHQTANVFAVYETAYWLV